MHYRGIVIHWIVKVESLIDDILVDYYTVPIPITLASTIRDVYHKKEEFLFSFLSKPNVNLDFKVSALHYIAKRHCPKFLSKHKELFHDIRELVEFRNILAHMKYNPDKSELASKTISFYRYTTDDNKPKVKEAQMNPKILNYLYVEYMECYRLLYDLENMLRSSSVDE